MIIQSNNTQHNGDEEQQKDAPSQELPSKFHMVFVLCLYIFFKNLLTLINCIWGENNHHGSSRIISNDVVLSYIFVVCLFLLCEHRQKQMTIAHTQPTIFFVSHFFHKLAKGNMNAMKKSLGPVKHLVKITRCLTSLFIFRVALITLIFFSRS